MTLVDSSGAGDAFAGGFIAGMLMGLDHAETLRFASAIGASCCMRLGCTTGIFTREQAEAFLAGASAAPANRRRDRPA